MYKKEREREEKDDKRQESCESAVDPPNSNTDKPPLEKKTLKALRPIFCDIFAHFSCGPTI